MKNVKVLALIMSVLVVLSGCNMSNMAKGGLIGGGAGAAAGAGVGYLIGKNGKGAAIGAAVGAAVGTTAGLLIGKKMDKKKAAAAAALQNAQVDLVKDANGLDAIKLTLNSGILFATNQATLNADAKETIKQIAAIINEDNETDIAIQGHTDNTGNDKINNPLSENRAKSVETYLKQCGVAGARIANVAGFGSKLPVADNSTAAGRELNRRVEIYMYPNETMINAANAGTLK